MHRLERAIAQAAGIYTRQFTPSANYTDRVLAELLENRALVSAHIGTTIEHIVDTMPADRQQYEVHQQTSDATDLTTRSALAIARLRALRDHEGQAA